MSYKSFGPFLGFEGTSDYLLGLPCTILTYQASGSISGGQGLCMAGDGTVYVETTFQTASTGSFVGMALKSAANGDRFGVIVFGPVKNLVAGGTVTEGNKFYLLNNGLFTASAPTGSSVAVGTAYSTATSGSTFIGFLGLP